MGRKAKVAADARQQDERQEIVESLLHFFSTKDHDVRRNFALSLKRLMNVLQTRHAISSEDDWLLQVEQSATQLHEDCDLFPDDCATQRQEVYRLLRSLEETCRLTDSNVNEVLDPVRVTLVCRSLMGSYRLQSQMDAQVLDEIRSFLSTLYNNIDFNIESSESNSAVVKDVVDKMNRWIEHVENPVFIECRPWREALQELHNLLVRDDTSKMQYHKMIKLDSAESCDTPPLNQCDSTSLMNKLIDSENVMDAVQSFLDVPEHSYFSCVSFLVVVGSQGSGKTFLCDGINRKAEMDERTIQGATYGCCQPANLIQSLPEIFVLTFVCALVATSLVLRPTLPIDLMGASLGESEDNMTSVFELARQSEKCILLLDDIDRILGQQEDSTRDGNRQSDAQPHSQMRLLSSFLSQLDSLRASESGGNYQVLIVGTASSDVGVDSIGRVDKVFLLESPNDAERGEIIMNSLGLSASDAPDNSILLTDLVDCTVGRSRSELVHYCRQAIASMSLRSTSAQPFSNEDILHSMKASLQSFAPESLRSGALSDFVDMKVLNARDLCAPNESASVETQMPLFGSDAMEAWEEMKSLVVVPLCQANALDELLYGAGKEGRKTVCGGVLLVGKPGCGKSRLAYHCASVAASLVPSMTLLDVSCSSLVHKEVGGSERALRHLFSSARAAAPCILLMDGIENIAAVRGHDNTTEGTMDRILSTLLVELDGVDSQSDGAGKIAVIGITHNERWIDPALRRPGRLEKVIVLRNPDYDARLQIVQKEFRSLPRAGAPAIDTSDLASYVASHTNGISGAEVLALCREARMESVRECIRQNKELDEFEGSIISRAHFVAAGLTM